MDINVNFLTVNLAIVTDKWPDIAQLLCSAHYDISQIELVEDNELSLVFDNIQVASSYDQKAEASIQIQSVTGGASQVALYGTGLGVVQRELLKISNLQALNVIILNIPLFKACLTYFDQQDWLLDRRVSLKVSTKTSKVNKPFIALPAELVLATNESASLRDRICLALDDEFIRQNKGIDNKKLQENITSNISFIKGDHDIQELFSTGHNNDKETNFIVCGAGPTLAEHYTWLQQKSIRDRFTIVAVDAAVMPLVQAGIIADIVVSIDPVAKKLFDKVNICDFQQVPLVYFPVVSGEFLSLWQGPRYTAYSTGDLYQKTNDKHPKGRLYCAGSVIHPAVDLAVKMAAKTVLLLGADFSFPDGRTHTYWEEDRAIDAVHITTKNTTHWVLNTLNERVPTLLNYRGYLRDLEDYITLAKHVEFFNGSKKGAYISGTELFSKKKWVEENNLEEKLSPKNQL